MIKQLIAWAVNNPLIVILLMFGLAGFGGYAFFNVNVEAYPDPAPAIVEVIAQYPGASAEEVERQVTIPLEVALAGMPGLKYTRSKSLFGLSHLRNQFEYGIDYEKARQEVINRLQFIEALPPGVMPTLLAAKSRPAKSSATRCTGPKDAAGRDIYTLNDLKALQDWSWSASSAACRGIIDVVQQRRHGQALRDPSRPRPAEALRHHARHSCKTPSPTATPTSAATTSSQGDNVLNVRGIGLIGGGLDPMQSPTCWHAKTPGRRRRLPARRGRTPHPRDPPDRDHVDQQRADPRRGRRRGRPAALPRRHRQAGRRRQPSDRGWAGSAMSRPMLDADRRTKSSTTTASASGSTSRRRCRASCCCARARHSLPALHDVEAKIKELNDTPGRLLPGVKIEPYYDRTDLIDVTTETVRENLLVGMVLVTVILLMFLSNVRSALIVAINIPLALLFAFAVLFLRGKSANLLSIGAVDFGIIVDSSVIMVENIYRHLSSGEYAELPLKRAHPARLRARSNGACSSRRRSWSAPSCRCSPCSGPEGQIFGPMADTYAFALGGALLLALTAGAGAVLVVLQEPQAASRDNFLVRLLKSRYLRQLEHLPELPLGDAGRHGRPDRRHRLSLLPLPGPRVHAASWKKATCGFAAPSRSTSRWTQSPSRSDQARAIMRQYPEVESIVPPDRPARRRHRSDRLLQRRVLRAAQAAEGVAEGPAEKPAGGAGSAPQPARTKTSWSREMNDELDQKHRRRQLELLAEHPRQRDGIAVRRQGRQLGQDHRPRPRRAGTAGRPGCKIVLADIHGIEDVGVFRIKGQSNLEFPVDRDKCSHWGVSVADVDDVIQIGRGRQAVLADDRGREDVRHHAALAGATAQRARTRSSTSRSTSPTIRLSRRPVRRAADAAHRRPAPACRAIGTSVAHAGVCTAASGTARSTTCRPIRRGRCATWSRRSTTGPARSRRATSSAPAPRRFTASRASA